MADLKPCPCGAGEPYWKFRDPLVMENRFKLNCHGCDRQTDIHITGWSAAEEWNTRASEARDE